MAWYSFKGTNSLGQKVQGRYNADSELSLVSRLQSAGITSATVKKLSFLQMYVLVLKRLVGKCFPIKKMDLSLFYYQLADMLEIGIPLRNALFVIASHLNNPRLINVIHDVIESLAKGNSFAGSLKKHERLFSTVTVQLIDLAHTKEELTAILRYCDQSMRRMTFLRKVFFVAVPQLSIMMVLFIVLFFLRFHYLRDFYYAIYVFKNPVPAVIRFFDTLTALFTVHWLGVTSVVVLSFIAFKVLLFFSRIARLFCDFLLCYLPVIRGVVLAVERERLALLYAVLLNGGASTQKCAQYSVAVINNLFFKRWVRAMSAAVHRGEVFSNALKYFNVFGAAEIQMIALGAISNSLVKTFERIYSVSQLVLERKLLLLIEFVRLALYLSNTIMFFFIIYVTETLFFYPGVR